MYPTYGPGHFHSLIFLMFFGFFGIIITIVVLIPYWFIFKKAGFSPFLALLMFLPIINIAMLYVLAFSRWNVVPAAQVYPAPVPYQPPYQPRA
jgi:Zn-dependent protease with chaperone function